MKVTIEGLKVEYKDEGRGPVLLMLHGWMSSTITFDRITEKLKDEYRVVRLDLPGFGDSEQPHSPWRINDYATFVAAFIHEIQIDPAAILGHSFGGRILIKGFGEGIVTAPKLILIDAEAGEEEGDIRTRIYGAAARAGKKLSTYVSRDLSTKIRQHFTNRGGDDYMDAEALAVTFLNTIDEDLMNDARHISVPTLLLWGGRDRTIPLSDGNRLAGAIRDSKLVVFPRARHWPHREYPKEVADAIRLFVSH